MGRIILAIFPRSSLNISLLINFKFSLGEPLSITIVASGLWATVSIVESRVAFFSEGLPFCVLFITVGSFIAFFSYFLCHLIWIFIPFFLNSLSQRGHLSLLASVGVAVWSAELPFFVYFFFSGFYIAYACASAGRRASFVIPCNLV